MQTANSQPIEYHHDFHRMKPPNENKKRLIFVFRENQPF